jgi:hypothetical protein
MTTSFLVAARPFVRILGTNGESDPAARRELRGHDCLSRRACFDEVVENAVRYCFVEGAFIPIRCQIKFERLAFDAEAIGNVIDVDPGEIWLACDWTNRSEIVRFKMNPVVPAGRRIRESLESRLGGRSGYSHFAPSEKRQSTCAFCFCHGDIKFAQGRLRSIAPTYLECAQIIGRARIFFGQ